MFFPRQKFQKPSNSSGCYLLWGWVSSSPLDLLNLIAQTRPRISIFNRLPQWFCCAIRFGNPCSGGKIKAIVDTFGPLSTAGLQNPQETIRNRLLGFTNPTLSPSCLRFKRRLSLESLFHQTGRRRCFYLSTIRFCFNCWKTVSWKLDPSSDMNDLGLNWQRAWTRESLNYLFGTMIQPQTWFLFQCVF